MIPARARGRYPHELTICTLVGVCCTWRCSAQVLRDVFACPRPTYPNSFFVARDMAAAIRAAPGPAGDALRARMAALSAKYADMSTVYQSVKDRSDNIALK